MRTFAFLFAAALAASAPAGRVAAQTAAPASAPVPGPPGVGGTPMVVPLPHLAITQALLAGVPRTTIGAVEEDGKTASYSGVVLDALLIKSGAPHGEGLRGKAVADYVLVTASDGYRAVFALVELDARFSDKMVLLADRRNGAPLDAKDGPFRIVVPDEKHHARWVRNVTQIDVLSPP
jgi:hypothetical protein